MSSHKQKAENIKFIIGDKSIEPVDSAFFGLSLRKGTQLGLLSLIIQEPIFHYFFWNNFDHNFQFWHIHLLIYSIFRVIVCLMLDKATKNNDFHACLNPYKKLKFMTLIQIFNTLLCFTLAANNIHANITMPRNPLLYQVAFIITILNVYTLYIIYSFIKNLGFGNFDLIEGRKIKIGQLLTFSNKSSSSDSTMASKSKSAKVLKYPKCERIVLTNPADIAFAQNAQNAIIDDLMLPSGIKVPCLRNSKSWRIIGNEVILS
jgi:hypothetical protein